MASMPTMFRAREWVKACLPPVFLKLIQRLRYGPDTPPDPYLEADRMFLPLDLARFKRMSNLRNMPPAAARYGGQVAYGEWCHTIGVFEAVMQLHRPHGGDLSILDIGCGTGKLSLAADGVMGPHGHYTGIDVRAEDVAFSASHYPAGRFEFIRIEVRNAFYNEQGHARALWPLLDGSRDVVTALSVWTHFMEDDARFYLAEVARVLKPGGVAVLTFFLMDSEYERRLPERKGEKWVFDVACPASAHWYHPSWASVPENAIGVRPEGVRSLLAGLPLDWTATYSGHWKGTPGMFFQDILVFTRREGGTITADQPGGAP